jgi:mRNA-degrading endonuclease RelE of RelBE toxin-antitoxin system
MSRASPRTVGPYRVNFSPEAWKQVGRISSGAFFSLQESLESIAGRMGSERPTDEGAHSELHAEVAGLRVIYQRDDETRTLTLLDIRPVHAEPH